MSTVTTYPKMHSPDQLRPCRCVDEHLYPDVYDGDTLAAKANAVLGNYTSQQCVVLKTDSIPQKIGDQMSAWLGVNGAIIEKALMGWQERPSPASVARKATAR